jgi:hypothetical protein
VLAGDLEWRPFIGTEHGQLHQMAHPGARGRLDNSAFLLWLPTALAGEQEDPVGSGKSGLEGLRTVQVRRHVFDVLPKPRARLVRIAY